MLADRGWGRAPQVVQVEEGETQGFTIIHRRWAPGTDPLAQAERIIDGQAKALPGGLLSDERIIGGPDHHPIRDT